DALTALKTSDAAQHQSPYEAKPPPRRAIDGRGRTIMRIGFIGLGNMGGPMALNLIKAGHALTVHDTRKNMAEGHLAAGAKWADTPADAAAGNELVLTSLPGPKEIEA